MKYLNLGCGEHFSTKAEWVNLDFTSSGEGVIAHNLLQGIPFESNSFDLVYHSHVLEHFSKADGEKLISECLRVLKPGGTLRIAIPDLEKIARNYLKFLEQGLQDPKNSMIRANYNWMLIEMYDQTVRNQSGGLMVDFLFQENLINEEFVFERIGEEGKEIRRKLLLSKNNSLKTTTHVKEQTGLKKKLKKYLLKRFRLGEETDAIGKFRLGGEIHQWMYDKYSLAFLLESFGTKNFVVRDAFTSNIAGWDIYQLDGKNNFVRKPDSLFVEAIKNGSET